MIGSEFFVDRSSLDLPSQVDQDQGGQVGQVGQVSGCVVDQELVECTQLDLLLRRPSSTQRPFRQMIMKRTLEQVLDPIQVVMVMTMNMVD